MVIVILGLFPSLKKMLTMSRILVILLLILGLRMVWFVPRICFVSIILVNFLVGLVRKIRWLFVRLFGSRRVLLLLYDGTYT